MKSSSSQKLTTRFMAARYTLCDGTCSVDCASLSIQTNLPLTFHCVSHWIFLQWDLKNLSFIRSWNHTLWVLAGFKSQSDMTDWLSTAQSPCQMDLSPSLRYSFKHNFQKWKMTICPILWKLWHRWREELKDRRKKQWEKCAKEPLSQLAGKTTKCLTCAHNSHWPDPWHKGG